MIPLKNELKETQLGKPSPEAQRLPFYPHLPKTEIGLIQWRVYVRLRSLKDLEFRQTIIQMCSHDPVFFIATFVDIHETRGTPRNVPFFPWMDQVDVLAWIAKDVGKRDIVVSKSRGIGMSWTFAAIFIWIWLFVAGADLGMVSKDADSLDLVGRPATLMGKLDYIFDHLPFYFRVDSEGKSILRRTHGQHRFENTMNGAAIVGYVPTDEKVRSARFYALLFDEFAFVDADPKKLMAATQGTTFCRIWLSTFNGMGNMFHRIAHNETSPLLRIRTFWWNNPYGAAGMYTSKNGVVTVLDEKYKFPLEGYPFIADGMLRSPFFDYEMSRAGANKQSMLEELNGVAAANTRKLIQGDYLAAVRRHAKVPVWRGDLTMDGEWIEDYDGPWRLWRYPHLVTDQLTIGVDPASGMEAGAFSAMTGIDPDIGEQVFTYSGHLTPIELSRLANTAGRVLTGAGRYALLNWETTGSLNATFTHEIQRLRYPRLFLDEKEHLGWHNTDRGESILWELARAIRDGEFVLYDQEIVDELELFEFDRDGELQWAGIEGHADRAMSLAIAWNAAKSRRKAILRARKQRDIITQQGPEAEPEWIAQQRSVDLWSAQFEKRY